MLIDRLKAAATGTRPIPQDIRALLSEAAEALADVRPVVVCADCKHNNACLTQAFVEDESRVPFDRNTFFCADGKRADMREES